MTTLALQIDAPSAISVSVSDDTLSVDSIDGRSISVPVEWSPLLYMLPQRSGLDGD